MGDERLNSLCLISVERDLSYGMMQNDRIQKIWLMILQRKEIEECIYGYKKTMFSLK